MIATLNEILANRFLVILLVVLGVVFTVRSGLMQWRLFGEMWRVTSRSVRSSKIAMGSYQALTMSLAGRVGAGNIAGVATAITLGGPGALFWMWIIGLLGMATSFMECTLAQIFKVRRPDGTLRGGPAFYIERGLRNRPLAIVFSLMLILHSGYVMTAFQSFTVAASVGDSLGISTINSGLLMTAVLSIIVFGGLQRISRTADLVVPFMVIGYIGAALLVLLLNLERVPDVAQSVFRSAFGLEPILGAGIGAAIVNGAKRGLFSNEAGLGTAPNVAAIAQTRHPAAQGIVQSLSVFIDTLLVCTATGVILLFSDVYWSGTGGGAVLTQMALAEHVGPAGKPFVSLALVLFAFTSVMYSYYLAENCLEHLRISSAATSFVFRVSVLAMVFWGSQQDLGTIFTIADLVMAILAMLNLYALVRLAPLALQFLRDYEDQRKRGVEEPELDPGAISKVGMDSSAWRD